MDDYYDDLVEADFAEKLIPSDIIGVMQIILDVATSKAAEGIFFAGFVRLEISPETVKVQLRFSIQQEELARLEAPDRDELPRKMARFTWHLFAKLDSKYALGNTTLPGSFRAYINLDE